MSQLENILLPCNLIRYAEQNRETMFSANHVICCCGKISCLLENSKINYCVPLKYDVAKVALLLLYFAANIYRKLLSAMRKIQYMVDIKLKYTFALVKILYGW